MNTRYMWYVLVLSFTWLFTSRVCAERVLYFRHDSGVVDKHPQPLPEKFDLSKQLIWRQPLAPGHSTPCVYGDSIYLTTFVEDQKKLWTVSLERKTGKVRWQQQAPATRVEPYHRVGSPASSTPACDGERCYAFFGSYGLLCYGLDGYKLWSKPLGPFQDEFGAPSSPILVDGKLILNEDHDINSFLIAVDQETGETVWRIPRDGFTRSYSTPIVWEVNGVKQLIVAGSLQLAAYDVEDGHKIWWVNGLSRIVDTTPVVAQGLLLVASWTPGGDQSERISMAAFAEALKQYDKNSDGKIAKTELPPGPVLTRFFRIDLDQDQALDETEWNKHARVFQLAQNAAMAILPGGKGDVTNTHVKWMHRRGLPTVPSPLAYRGIVYMVKDSGIITTLGMAGGNLLKQGRAAGRGNYYASPVAGDGKVYLASESGVVTVLRHAAEWELLSSHDFGERIMATPVISDGRIYLRTEKALYCIGKH